MLRDGHAPRLHLHRRSRRRRDPRRARRGRGSGYYHVSTGSDYAIKELFDATIDALEIELEEDVEVTAAHPTTTPTRSCSTRRASEPTSAGMSTVRSTRASPERSPTTASSGSPRRSPTSSRRDDRKLARSRDASESSSSAAPASSAPISSARCWSTSPREILVVDNLLSSERGERARAPAGPLVEGSITRRARARRACPTTSTTCSTWRPTTATRARWPIRSPTTSTTRFSTLRLLRGAQGLHGLERVVYASAGCTVAEKTFDGAEATTEDAPVSLWLDSPYQISKIIGEYYSNYYFTRHGLAGGEGTLSERVRPRRDPRRRTLARTPQHRVAQRRPDVRLQGAPPRGAAGRERRRRHPRLHLRRGHGSGTDRAARTRGEPGEIYNLASGVETSIRELAELINELTGNPTPIALTPARDWDHSGQRYGSPDKAREALGFSADVGLREGLERDDRLDAREPRLDRAVHRPPPRADRRSSTARRGG